MNERSIRSTRGAVSLCLGLLIALGCTLCGCHSSSFTPTAAKPIPAPPSQAFAQANKIPDPAARANALASLNAMTNAANGNSQEPTKQ